MVSARAGDPASRYSCAIRRSTLRIFRRFGFKRQDLGEQLLLQAALDEKCWPAPDARPIAVRPPWSSRFHKSRDGSTRTRSPTRPRAPADAPRPDWSRRHSGLRSSSSASSAARLVELAGLDQRRYQLQRVLAIRTIQCVGFSQRLDRVGGAALGEQSGPGLVIAACFAEHFGVFRAGEKHVDAPQGAHAHRDHDHEPPFTSHGPFFVSRVVDERRRRPEHPAASRSRTPVGDWRGSLPVSCPPPRIPFAPARATADDRDARRGSWCCAPIKSRRDAP